MQEKLIYKGAQDYVTVLEHEHKRKRGAEIFVQNPAPTKLQAIDGQTITELAEGLEAALAIPDCAFIVFSDPCELLYVGADITKFAGKFDIGPIREQTFRGIEVDNRLKALIGTIKTVSIIFGNRFGGSTELPLMAETSVCDDKSVIQLTEVQLGIIPGWDGFVNCLLRSGRQNAEYICKTGNRIDAEMMKRAGIVEKVVRTPPRPDKKSFDTEEDYRGALSEYRLRCRNLMLREALDVAVSDSIQAKEPEPIEAHEGLVHREVRLRSDPARYRELMREVEKRLNALGDAPQQDNMRELQGFINERLRELGRPLAPRAVEGIDRLLEKYGDMNRLDLLQHFPEMSRLEGEIICELMLTSHREIGVDAVLTKDPLKKIPVFD